MSTPMPPTHAIRNGDLVAGYIFIELPGPIPANYRAHRLGDAGAFAILDATEINGWRPIPLDQYPGT